MDEEFLKFLKAKYRERPPLTYLITGEDLISKLPDAMRLEENVYANDASLESFISSCPVLEDLSILRMVEDNIKVLRVHSLTLTSLDIDFYFGENDDMVDDFDTKHSEVLIDAPRLKYLKFQDDLSESKVITNSGSLAKVNIVYVFNENDCADVVDLPRRNMVRNFFISISGVRDMKISGHFVETNLSKPPVTLRGYQSRAPVLHSSATNRRSSSVPESETNNDRERVDIDVNYDVFYNHSAGNVSSKRSAVRKFLIGLPNVRDMTISGKTLKINLSLLEPRTAAPVSSNPWFCFASGFLDFHKDSCLHKFKIFGKRKDVSMCTIMWWLHNAVKRKIRHLDVECYLEQTIDMVPLSLYLSETLVSLRVKCLVLVCFEFVSLPNLKSLNSLKIVVDCTKEWCIGANGDWKVFIDAPRLAYLSLTDTYSVSFEISNLGSSAEVDIDVSFKVNKIWDLDDSFDRSNVCILLTGLASVRDMTIRETTLKDLQKVRGRVENEEISLSSSSVPKCLQSSLEDVAIIRPNYGNGAEMKLSKYFLENSLVLKRFTLDMDCDNEEQENIIFEQFETVQRRSSACEASLVVRDMMYPLSELML
ncbi:predicted protein [Arabidopsis lyrata subsp. lyrata]|uniref:Predicted protein n=1 Tax=Arabidopsis lyrata subsp. lyrata TaxID=81972 RepID=D7M1H9_ARALL|nr:predicted protein [Arabidopsis lyrata subsp. lyrata]